MILYHNSLQCKGLTTIKMLFLTITFLKTTLMKIKKIMLQLLKFSHKAHIKLEWFCYKMGRQIKIRS